MTPTTVNTTFGWGQLGFCYFKLTPAQKLFSALILHGNLARIPINKKIERG